MATLQDTCTTEVTRAAVKDLCRADSESKLPVLYDHQQEAISKLIERKRSICQLEPGGGKTLILIGLHRRLLFSRRMAPGEMFLVLSQAALVDQVFVAEIHNFGSPELSFAVRSVEEAPPSSASFVVASLHMLAGLKKRHFDPSTGLLWQRKIHTIAIDEVHRLRSDKTWCNEVAELSRSSTMSFGLTATVFVNEPGRTANICKALCLHPDVCKISFWMQKNSLQLSEAPPYRAFFSVEVPQKPEERKKRLSRIREYEAEHEELPSSPCFTNLSECLSESPAFLERLRLARGMNLKLELLRSKELALGPKVQSFLAETQKLFREGYFKLFVSVYYRNVLLLLEHLLSLHRDPAGLQVFSYSGWKPAAENRTALSEFLEVPCAEGSYSVLLMSITAGGTGLNIVNGDRSPMAHIEFDQPSLATERFQVQCRVKRTGNPYEVKLVVLTGEGTQTGRILRRHSIQTKKHKWSGERKTQEQMLAAGDVVSEEE